jgi:transcriptional regulator with PAS, ATPase and Fis domain
MQSFDWAMSFPGKVIVCDAEGIIIYLNDAAAEGFQKRGGRALIGTNLYDCHADASGEKIRQLLREKQTNVYTIEKGGKKKMIYQAPWYREGQVAGLLEISFEIPGTIPHFVREENG